MSSRFLLAQLIFQSLKDKTTPGKLRKALKQLVEQNTGQGGDQKLKVFSLTYDQTMERINSQLDDLRELATLVLVWITCATRPLTTPKLQHALAVEPGDNEFDQDNLPDVQDMVSACVGLVTVEDESDIIRLVHYTGQEYFEQTQQRWFPDAEDGISLRCVTYLSLIDFDVGWCHEYEDFLNRLQSYPLYQYAGGNWAHHTNKASTVADAVLRFLLSAPHAEAASQLVHAQLWGDGGLYKDSSMPGLHLAVHLGAAEAIPSSDREVRPGRKRSEPLRSIASSLPHPRCPMTPPLGMTMLPLEPTVIGPYPGQPAVLVRHPPAGPGQAGV